MASIRIVLMRQVSLDEVGIFIKPLESIQKLHRTAIKSLVDYCDMISWFFRPIGQRSLSVRVNFISVDVMIAGDDKQAFFREWQTVSSANNK